MQCGPSRAELCAAAKQFGRGRANPSDRQHVAVRCGAIRIDGAHFKAYYNRAFAYSKVGLYARAVDSYTDALRVDASSANAHHNRGALSAHSAAAAAVVRALAGPRGNGSSGNGPSGNGPSMAPLWER